YHDHPWATEQFFWTHAEWHWARASTPDSNVMFATVTPFPGIEGKLWFAWVGTPGQFEPTVTGTVNVSPSAWNKDSLMGIRFPHQLVVSTPDATWTSTYQHSLLDVPYYTRSAVAWAPANDTAGTGWAEYWMLKASGQKLVFWLAKISAFFWRPFPF